VLENVNKKSKQFCFITLAGRRTLDVFLLKIVSLPRRVRTSVLFDFCHVQDKARRLANLIRDIFQWLYLSPRVLYKLWKLICIHAAQLSCATVAQISWRAVVQQLPNSLATKTVAALLPRRTNVFILLCNIAATDFVARPLRDCSATVWQQHVNFVARLSFLEWMRYCIMYKNALCVITHLDFSLSVCLQFAMKFLAKCSAEFVSHNLRCIEAM